MLATKKTALVTVVVCLVILAVWLAVRSFAPSVYDENLLTEDERLAAAYRTLEGVSRGGWIKSAFRVGAYGDPEEATEAIIDLIQNRDDMTPKNMKGLEEWSEREIASSRGAAYMARIQVLSYLGLTRTKYAEEFLLNAYKNPQDLVPYKKYVQLAGPSGNATFSDWTFLEALTWRYALTGLMLLDEPKHSPMLEEDFYRLMPDAERIYKKENPRGTDEDSLLLRRWGTLLDVLATRDVIREHGTENPEYLLEPDALVGDVRKYWNFQTKTAVPR
ncbi:MAG: hypothetical protein IID08_00765 [Candidatus Hydrogenedentes bacterium]|nr:hypothetical protein [Candidatus Hydrogenedentota bacterium]